MLLSIQLFKFFVGHGLSILLRFKCLIV
jgi:hypothetical protein